MTSSDDTAASPDAERRGEARGKAAALLAILASKGNNPTPDQRARIEQCPDPATIDRWIQAALRGEPFDAVPAATGTTTDPKKSILLPIAIAALVAVTLFTSLIGLAFWSARGSESSITPGSARLVSQLGGVMTIDVHVTRGLPKVNAFADGLKRLLAQYEKASDGKLKVRFIDVQTDEQHAAAKEEGLQLVMLAEAGEAKSATIVQGVLGLVFKYKADKDVIPTLSPDNSGGLEFWISNKIRELRMKADGEHLRVGVLTGVGEIPLSEANLVSATSGPAGPSIRSIFAQAMPYYTFENVDLRGGDAAVDEGLKGLIITQPSRDLNDAELRRIDQFVMRGKSLAAFVSAVNVPASDASMKPSLDLHNLDKLLAGYGIAVAPDLIIHTEDALGIPVVGATVRAPCAFVSANDSAAASEVQRLDNTFAAFFRLESVAFPYASSLEIRPDKQPDARLRVLARTGTSARSVRDEGVSCKPTLEPKVDGPTAQRSVAASAEGTLLSATRSWDGASGFEIPKKSAEGARVFVVASSHFLTNPFARAGNPPPSADPMMPSIGGDPTLRAIAQSYAQAHLTTTILCFKNTLDWMTGDADLVEASGTLLVSEDEPSALTRAAKWLTTW